MLSVADCVSAYPNIVTNDQVLCARGEADDDDNDDARSRSSLLADACQVIYSDTLLRRMVTTCVMQGDSGGPLVMEDRQSGLFTLVGVVTGVSIIIWRIQLSF